MDNPAFAPGPPAGFKRMDIPVKMGIITGIVAVLIEAMNFMFVLPASFITFSILELFVFVVYVIMYSVTGVQQRKAMGGYINIKDAFQAIFVVILISSLIVSVWGIIYGKWIDPEIGTKVKAGTLALMERFNAPEEEIDKRAKEMDRQLADSLKVKSILYGFATGLVFKGIVGFIIAAIVRKNPPAAQG